MGFGICLIGYAFLLLYEFGGGIFASVLMGYGFFLVSRLEKRFLAAALSALFMLPHSILLLLDAFSYIKLDQMPTLYLISYLVYLLAWLSVSFWYLTSVRRIARACEAPKLAAKASNRLYLTALFICTAVVFVLLQEIASMVMGVLLYIVQYVVIILNILFLHTCQILITSEKEYEKDRDYIRQVQEMEMKRIENGGKPRRKRRR